MFILDPIKGRKRPGSNIALAVALLCGSALTAGVLASPVAAKDRKEEKPPKTDYSKEFITSYTAADALLKLTPPDVAGTQAAIPGMLAMVKTPDDKMAAGGLVYNTGIAASNVALQRQGFDLMIESGKIPAESKAQYYYNAGQLAYQEDDFDTARARFGEALAAGYDADLENVIATTYFNEDRTAEGVAYYRGLIDAKVAEGQNPSEDWLFRAFSAAYNNDMGLEAIEFANRSVRYYPTEKNWRNAISVQRNFVQMKDDVVLDLMRLAYRTGTVVDGRDYADYIEAADPRRLPGEVKRLVDEAVAKGALTASDPFVADARSEANARIAADKADLPSLLNDSRKAGSTAVTATAAGDVFLSYGEAATAEEMYAVAETKAGVDMGRVLTRKGIAQVYQGKFVEAEANFEKVGGARKAVADLWAAYAGNKAAAMPATATTAPAVATTDEAMQK